MEYLLFLIRLAALASLYAFLAVAMWLIWTELRELSKRSSAGEREHRARLIVLESGETGLTAGETLAIGESVSLGRALDNSVALLDSSVSAKHAIVTFKDGQWWLEDRNSTNGTTLNGTRVRGRVVLKEHDVIGLGQVRLKLQAES